jgi:hypothetical protein
MKKYQFKILIKKISINLIEKKNHLRKLRGTKSLFGALLDDKTCYYWC